MFAVVVIILVSLEVLSAWPIKCAYAVQEIYKTEADYVQALEDILQVCICVGM